MPQERPVMLSTYNVKHDLRRCSFGDNPHTMLIEDDLRRCSFKTIFSLKRYCVWCALFFYGLTRSIS